MLPGAYDTVFFPQAAQVSSRDSASANSQIFFTFFMRFIPRKSAIRRGAFAPLRWLFRCYLTARFFRLRITTPAAASTALPSQTTIWLSSAVLAESFLPLPAVLLPP